MFKYNGVEYRTRKDAEDHIITNASILQNNYRIDEYNLLMKKKNDAEFQLEVIASESERAKENFIKTELAKITNQEYQFISTGFFIEGMIEKLTDTEMVMKHGQYQYIAYEILRNNNMIFTKPKTIEVERYFNVPLQYQIIGIESYYLILKSDNNILLATSVNKDGVRTRINVSSVSNKVHRLKNATIPLDEDRTFVSKWLMKNTNKE